MTPARTRWTADMPNRLKHKGAPVILPTVAGEPTGVLPGPLKVEVLATRYAAGQFLHHPKDARRE